MQKELYNRIWTMIDHTILGSMVDFSESPDPYGELCLWEDDTFLSNCLYLSFGIVLLLMLFVYMVVYELRLRGKYEKDN